MRTHNPVVVALFLCFGCGRQTGLVVPDAGGGDSDGNTDTIVDAFMMDAGLDRMVQTDGTRDTNTGADAGACLPECILTIKFPCSPNNEGMCLVQTPNDRERDICYGNGVKLTQVTESPTSRTLAAYRADGTLCYTETIQNGLQTFVDDAGNVAATVRTDSSGVSTATCRDGQVVSYHPDSPACMAYSAIGGPCVQGSCSP
jgi:hypothetical protein